VRTERGVAGSLAGCAAAAVALGVSELVAIATGPRTSPLVAVGAVVVDAAPRPVVEFAIRVFGTADRVALQVGTIVLLAAAAAALGAAAAHWWPVAPVALVAFAALGASAAVTRPGAGAVAALPTVAGALAAGLTYALLHRRFATPPRGPTCVATGQVHDVHLARSTRRRLLGVAATVVGVAAVAGLAGRYLSNVRGVSQARGDVALPPPADPAPPVPPGSDLGVPGLASYVTPNDDFYRVDTALVVPQVDPRQWRLRIHGRVRRPYTLTFQDLLERPMVERWITLTCVSNPVGGPFIGNARWLGVPVADLLAEAGPLPGADQVVSRSVDGWTCGTPTSVLMDGRDALLAVAMNGEPLPPEHGFPVRMVVPGLYGYVSACKWISEIELSSFDDFDAYWVRRGWAAQAPVKTQSRIDVPRGRVRAGTVTVAGVAWAQHRGIARVEVRIDDGDWQEATLADTVSADTWRQWSLRWEATPGRHRLTVRATDGDGVTQPEQPAPPVPDGATGWHTVEVEVT
jgi:DMSO/TMAO reductase YedYZ molybdopterin-dependent catalytic subunit